MTLACDPGYKCYGFADPTLRLSPDDERSSDDLARRLNLRSWRKAHPVEVVEFCRCGCGVRLEPGQAFAGVYCQRDYSRRARQASKRCACGSDGPLNTVGQCAKCAPEHALSARWETLGVKALQPGERFGSRVVLLLSPTRGTEGRVLYRVRCDCGLVTLARGDMLRSGKGNRCGRCARRERVSTRMG